MLKYVVDDWTILVHTTTEINYKLTTIFIDIAKMVRRRTKRKPSLINELKTLVMHGRNDELLTIVKNSTTPSLVYNKGMPLLHLAIKYDNLDLISSLLEIGCDVNAKNSSNLTPLMIAVDNCRYEAITILLNADADVCILDSGGKTVLHTLLGRQSSAPEDVIELVLTKLKAANLDTETMADLLLEAGYPLDLVLIHINDTEVMREMFNREVFINEDECKKFLDLVIKSVDLENLRLFANSGGYSSRYNRTQAFIRKLSRTINSCEGDFELVRPFVMDFVNWDVTNEVLLRFLRRIFGAAEKEVIRLFLDCEVADHVKDVIGEDLIARIFGNTNEDVIDLLKNREFDVNGRDVLGFRPLHFAAAQGLENNAKFLLLKGADPNARNDRGRTPLICYNAWTNVSVVERLIKAGANMQVWDYGGSTIIDVFEHSMLLETVVARIAILQARDVEIRQIIRDQIDGNVGLKKFYDQCLRQLEEMKSFEVSTSDTLFGVLTKDVERLNVRDEEKKKVVAEFYEGKDFEATYGMMLMKKMEDAFKVYELRKRAADFVAECVEFIIDAQHLVMEKIIGYLSYDDLIVFEERVCDEWDVDNL